MAPSLPALSLTALERLLREHGLRPTRQRLALGGLLFGGPSRHVTPEQLHREADARGAAVSLATVYNTLNQLRDAGLLSQVCVGSDGTWFDTRTEPHHHLFHEGHGTLCDLPATFELPAPLGLPEGVEVRRVDLVVRVRGA